MSAFGWNYPPGVTGNEPEIAGWPPCRGCGHEAEDHEDECPFDKYGQCAEDCGHPMCIGPDCTCREYRDEFDPWLDGPDPDAKRDREREGW